MKRTRALVSCILAALALGACASSGDRSSFSPSDGMTTKSSVASTTGSAAGGGGQAANSANVRSNK